MGTIDGAWWPRSRDALAEFPAMIAGLEWRLGQPHRVAFNADAWIAAPHRMMVDGQAISFEGFHSLDKHTVLVAGHGWHRLALLVVPPEAPEHAAVAALARAADPANTESAAQILACSDIGSGVTEVAVPAARGDSQPARRS
ncbi:hypothetical protein BAY60_23740 [Prauserella muralis]|uniref:Uncharacterized protein n=2 Tax=Prauserella muralis TaxID=588067 RepID=A0A2V4AQ20_9PSEU|nr:hypothetical protein BAY60_23740 [Prauserella muralis]